MRTLDPMSPSLEERRQRRPPGHGEETASENSLRLLRSFSFTHLVAPNSPGRAEDLNTLILSTWVEIQLLTEDGTPIRNERCHLYREDGTIIEARTDGDGVARWDELPSFCDDLKRADALFRPPLVLPDVLEECHDDPDGTFGKNKGARDDYRRRDGAVHFVPANHARYPIYLCALSEEEKFQHFRKAYEDHKAHYGGSSPRVFDADNKRWKWGRGAKCNQHINFFLGYWYNYNNNFTTTGSATAMIAIMMYDSEQQKFGKEGMKHRGYREFLEPLTGFSQARKTDHSAFPPPERYNFSGNSADYYTEYINVARYFDATGMPRTEGRTLISALSDINVYSLADLNDRDLRSGAASKIRGWLAKQDKDSKYGVLLASLKKKAGGASENAVLDLAWNLEPTEYPELLAYITASVYLNYDHHCGILLRRGPEGGDPRGVDAADLELWTFSADGSDSNQRPIKMKRFSEYFSETKNRQLPHLSIWKLKALRPGGFAPSVECSPELDLNTPPRFIRWAT